MAGSLGITEHKLETMLPKDIYRKLHVISIRNRMGFSEFIAYLLERNVEQYEKANGQIFLADFSASPR